MRILNGKELFFPSKSTVLNTFCIACLEHFRGNKTSPVFDRQESNIHQDASDEPYVPVRLYLLPNHKKHVLVGRRAQGVCVEASNHIVGGNRDSTRCQSTAFTPRLIYPPPGGPRDQ